MMNGMNTVCMKNFLPHKSITTPEARHPSGLSKLRELAGKMKHFQAI